MHISKSIINNIKANINNKMTLLKKPPISLWNLNALAFLLGGTLGNGIDRLLKGHVVDFLEIVPVNFPIFNIADISINIAIIFFIIDIVKIKSKSRL